MRAEVLDVDTGEALPFPTETLLEQLCAGWVYATVVSGHTCLVPVAEAIVMQQGGYKVRKVRLAVSR